MILQEKIQNKAERFGKLAPVFLEGAKFALENQWIKVEDDLPCNHEELISLDDKRDTTYVVALVHGYIILSRMCEIDGKWQWENDEPTHWFPFPKLPEETGDETMPEDVNECVNYEEFFNKTMAKEIGDKTMREDIRGYCNRDCIYCDNGRCDMWDDFAMPEDVNKCDNYTENF